MARLTPTRDSGFSLIEVLASVGLTALAGTAAMGLAHHGAAAALVQPAFADAQQRTRVGSDALFNDLLSAGAGIDAAGDGTLARFFPPVLPRRLGGPAPDARHIARGDVLSIVSLPPAAPQSKLGGPLAPGADLPVDTGEPRCRHARPLCGFVTSDTALVFDHTGRFTLLELQAIGPSSASARLLHPSVSHVFQAGDPVGRGQVRVYYFDAVQSQLRLADAYRSDIPLLDDVVGVSFEYLGEPAPPEYPRPPLGVANCLFDAAGAPISGLADLRTPGGPTVVPLPLEMLADGPWCGQGGIEFDADLLRVRRIGIRLRVQAPGASVRGTGPEFARPGTARSGLRTVPDVAVRIDVSPANLQVSR